MFSFFFYCYGAHRDLHSFPTRRSSDLASRLSFFVWNTVPDAELVRVATNGTLHTAAVLDKQVRRMLARSEEHTSELQSRENLVCRLLLEKKKNSTDTRRPCSKQPAPAQ